MKVRIASSARAPPSSSSCSSGISMLHRIRPSASRNAATITTSRSLSSDKRICTCFLEGRCSRNLSWIHPFCFHQVSHRDISLPDTRVWRSDSPFWASPRHPRDLNSLLVAALILSKRHRLIAAVAVDLAYNVAFPLDLDPRRLRGLGLHHHAADGGDHRPPNLITPQWLGHGAVVDPSLQLLTNAFATRDNSARFARVLRPTTGATIGRTPASHGNRRPIRIAAAAPAVSATERALAP